MCLINRINGLILLFVCLICVQANLDPNSKGVCKKKITLSFGQYWQRKRECASMTNEQRCLDNLEKEVHKTVYVCCHGWSEKEDLCEPQCPNGCLHGDCVAPNKCDCLVNFGGMNCNKTCPSGRFGMSCEKNCKCLLDPFCDANGVYCSCERDMSERCKDACKCRSDSCEPGTHGKNCEIACPDGTFGNHCMEECSCNRTGTKSCEKKNGKCNCMPNFFGKKCEMLCEGLLRCKDDSRIDCECSKSLEEKIENANKFIGELSTKIDSLMEKVDANGQRYEQHAKETDSNFEQKNSQIEQIKNGLQAKIDQNHEYYTRLAESIDQLNGSSGMIKEKINDTVQKLDQFKIQIEENKNKLSKKIDRVKSDIEKEILERIDENKLSQEIDRAKNDIEKTIDHRVGESEKKLSQVINRIKIDTEWKIEDQEIEWSKEWLESRSIMKAEFNYLLRSVKKYRIDQINLQIKMLLAIIGLVIILCVLIFVYKIKNRRLKHEMKMSKLRTNRSDQITNPIYEPTGSSCSKPTAHGNLGKVVSYSKKLGTSLPGKLFRQKIPLDMNAGRQTAIANIYASIEQIKNASKESRLDLDKL